VKLPFRDSPIGNPKSQFAPRASEMSGDGCCVNNLFWINSAKDLLRKADWNAAHR
jgi:hypothetical protein